MGTNTSRTKSTNTSQNTSRSASNSTNAQVTAYSIAPVHVPPIAKKRVNKLEFYKGRVHISYNSKLRGIGAWLPWQTDNGSKNLYRQRPISYTAGTLVYVGIDADCTRIGFWAVCMKDHIPKQETKPNKHSTFSDLLLEIIPTLNSVLHPQIAQIVINYAYLPNKYWWNGCCTVFNDQSNKKHNDADIYRNDDDISTTKSCGKLVCLESTYKCKECYYSMTHGNLDTISKYNYGAIIKLNKQGFFHQYTKNIKQISFKNVLLKREIKSVFERKQIRNLLWRNFNDSMMDLIDGCLAFEPSKHKFIKKYKINNLNKNNIHIWGLYDNKGSELLCALIWRRVVNGLMSGYLNNNNNSELLIMFEVLFVSTSEHVRFQKYGNEMVRRIEIFAKEQCYDIITVAAVPNQGISFWEQNSFEKFLDKNSSPFQFDNNIIYITKRNRIKQFVYDNMLIFSDTPLYVKLL